MLSKINLGKEKKATPYKNDMIVDPMGQWKHPGENTRIPGNNITMQGVNYPVLGVGSDGQKQMMYPGQDYQFPGASYVDEYPQMRRGGILPKAQYGQSYGCGPGTQWNPITKACVPIPRPTIVNSYDDPRYQRFLEQENLYNYSLLENFNQRHELYPKDVLYGDFSEWAKERDNFEKYNPGEELPYDLDDDDTTGAYGSKAIENYIPKNQLRRFIDAPQFPYMVGPGQWGFGEGKDILKKYPPAGYHTYDQYTSQPYNSWFKTNQNAWYGSNRYWTKPNTAFVEDEVNREALKQVYPLMTDADIDQHMDDARDYPSYTTNYVDPYYRDYVWGERYSSQIPKTEDGLFDKTYQITRAEANDPDNYYPSGMGPRKAYLQESEKDHIYRSGQYLPVWGPPKEYFDWIPKLPILPIKENEYEDEIIPTSYNWTPPKKDPVVDNYEEELHTKKMPIIDKQPIYKTDANGMMYISGYKEVILGYEDIQGRDAGHKVEPTTYQLNTGNSYKKGGGIKTKKYSRSLESTNKLFSENSLLKKLKSRKKKIYDPKAKYYQEGGTPEDYDQFLSYSDTAPENRRPTEGYTYGDPNDYDHYGMWDALGKPQNFEQALEMNPDWQPDEYDGSYHGFSVNPNTGVFLKSGKPGMKPGDTTWMEVKDHYLSNRSNSSNLTFNPDLQRFQYTPNEEYIETELTPEEIEQYQQGGYIVEDISTPELNQAQEGGRTYDGYDPEFDPYGGAPLTEHEKLSCFRPPQPEDFDDGIIPYYVLKRYEDWYSKNGYKIEPPVRPEVVMTPRPIDRSSLEREYPEQEPTWNFKAPELDLPIKVREDHWGEQVGTTKQPIFETKVVPTMGADGIYRNVYKKVIVGYQDVQGMQYHNEEPTFHNLETGSSSGYQKGGALPKAQVGISDPEEYAFRKAAYDDSLYLYNQNQDKFPKKGPWHYYTNNIVGEKLDKSREARLRPVKHKDSVKVLHGIDKSIYETFARRKQEESPHYKQYNRTHSERPLPDNFPIKADRQEYYYDATAFKNPFTGTTYGVTPPFLDYIKGDSKAKARYKKPVQPVYLVKEGDKDKDKSKSKGNKSKGNKSKSNSKGKDTGNHVKEKVVTEPEVNIEDIRLPILPPKTIERQYPDEIIQRPNYTVYPRQAGDIVPPQSKEIWKTLPDGTRYRIERPVDPRLTKPVKVGFYKRGGSLLTKKVTCKNCGWKWDADDGGNDVTTCHKCGGQGLIHARKGGIPKAQDGVTYVNDLKDPKLLEYQERMRLYELGQQKKAEYYEMLKQLGIGGLDDVEEEAITEFYNSDEVSPLLTENYWKDYTYKPDTFGEHFGGLYQNGKDYVQYPGVKPGETVKMSGEDKDKIFNGYATWSKPDEVRYEEIELPIKPIDEVVLPEPKMATIKQYYAGPRNMFGNVPKRKRDEAEWREVQVPADSKQAELWQERLEWSKKNNPDTPLQNFSIEAVNPIKKKGGQGLVHAQKGGMTMGQEVDLTPAQEAHLRKLGYKLERI